MSGTADNGGMGVNTIGSVTPQPIMQPYSPMQNIFGSTQPQGPQYGQPGFGMHNQPGQWQNRQSNQPLNSVSYPGIQQGLPQQFMTAPGIMNPNTVTPNPAPTLPQASTGIAGIGQPQIQGRR
jgi:hypothetical protein